MLSLLKFVVHELMKEQGATQAGLFFSETMFELDAKVEALAIKLHESFARENIQYTQFQTAGSFVFPAAFQAYEATDRSDTAFMEFTRQVSGDLRTAIQGIALAKGGYLAFAEYGFEKKRFVAVFLIRDTPGLFFQRNDEVQRLQIESIAVLNTEKLALACRIDANRFAAGEQAYIHLINNEKRQREMPDYFVQWIAAQNPAGSRQYTESLIELLNYAEKPKDPDTNEAFSMEDFSKSVHKYIQTTPEKSVNLRDLSREYYHNVEYLPNLAAEQQLDLSDEFKVHGPTFSRLRTVSVQADGISLRCKPSDLKENRVWVDGDRLVIESEEMCMQIMAWLESMQPEEE